MLIIENIDIFKTLYEIELKAEPNHNFDVFIENNNFIIDIRTFIQKQTRINIKLNNEIITQQAPVNISNINLNFYSSFKKGAFFFIANYHKKTNNLNFENFNNDLRLYYGSF
ncbi:hypothetical protein [Campylobacter sp.]|uniref:phage baseplate plug family protein n=1 Tax=Campylobacter sp. TaxID=205 RepID=UPI0025BDA2D9|nr:hypothetical protein [Campylobacter sp.]